MKTRFILSILLMISISSVFANNVEDVNKNVIQNFKKDFEAASEVKWKVTGQFTKVTFKLNEQVLIAYYNTDGDRIAVSRNLHPTQLPLTLSAEFQKFYSQYWITDMFEILDINGTSYYMTIENADQRVTLKASSYSGWTTYKKKSKD